MSPSMLIPIITSNIVASNKQKKKSNTKVYESKKNILIGTDFEMIEYNVNGEAKTITNIVYINGMKKMKIYTYNLKVILPYRINHILLKI